MAASMNRVLTAVISIAVSVIVIATVLAPTLSDYTGTGGALESYAGLLGAIVVMSIVGVLMIAVKLVSGGRN